jgi:hypothetical protein
LCTEPNNFSKIYTSDLGKLWEKIVAYIGLGDFRLAILLSEQLENEMANQNIIK